ncbi:hypothetical protein [uncultured Kordia sp.]|uniref:hypothetical protein n=1 Tax=uncultured Kordia sp. TaxID=507699 RepID=UPI00262060C6|nr:hypothetical protein [uncultured Kordia sp.]
MKKLTLLLILFSSFLCVAQEENKETVYLLFDSKSKEKCIIEDGSGNSQNLNAYRKAYQDHNNLTFFHIYKESFAFGSNKRKDTCNIKELDNLKIVDVAYIQDKKSKNIMKYNPFKKIYIIEVISKDQFVKYDVLWIDDWTMTRD